MRLLRTRLLALIAAVFTAVPGQALVSTSYLCHMTGEVSGSHCCTGKRAEVCHAALEQQDCCEIIQAHGQTPTPSTRGGWPDVSVAAWVATPALAALAHATPDAWILRPRAAVTHPPGPPRFLVHCSLLI